MGEGIQHPVAGEDLNSLSRSKPVRQKPVCLHVCGTCSISRHDNGHCPSVHPPSPFLCHLYWKVPPLKLSALRLFSALFPVRVHPVLTLPLTPALHVCKRGEGLSPPPSPGTSRMLSPLPAEGEVQGLLGPAWARR